MGLYLNPGNEEFRNAAIHSKIYVDKTEMIKFTNSQLFGEHKNICVSRPRRFGKSMAANMLVAYYSSSTVLARPIASHPPLLVRPSTIA